MITNDPNKHAASTPPPTLLATPPPLCYHKPFINFAGTNDQGWV